MSHRDRSSTTRGHLAALRAAAAVAGIVAPALGIGGGVHAAILHVPGDYATIQEAIYAASAGDQVVVGPGTYHERLLVARSIHLLGQSGYEATVIDAEGQGTAVRFESTLADGAILEGFTVQNGASIGVDAGGVCTVDCSPVVRGNLIRHNWESGLSARGEGAPLFEGNLVIENGQGIVHWQSSATIRGNTIAHNAGPGIELANRPPVEISGNLIFSNGGGGIEGTIPEGVPACWIAGNTLVGNGNGIEVSYFADSIQFSRNIVAANRSRGVLCWGGGGSCPALSCNDVWGNAIDYEGTDPGWDDISQDPLFCDALLEDFAIAAGSPCLPESSPCGMLIGALAQGCGPTPVRMGTWGSIKAVYRTRYDAKRDR